MEAPLANYYDRAIASATQGRLMATRTKRQLVEQLAKNTDTTQLEAAANIDGFLALLADTLVAGDRIEFRDFGVFEPIVRKARTAQNPKTLTKVQVPERLAIRFKIGRELKARLRAPIATA
jgi:nucleoid DNA-binding protein